MITPHHQLLAMANLPLRLAKRVGRPLGLASPHCLRVLLYHDIPPQDQAQFAAQLRWLAQSWTFVSPERFGTLVSGQEQIQGRNLLVTFDDCFASNRVVAEKVLNPMGIRAVFFAVSDFVDLTDHDEARQFITRHIYPELHAHELPAHLYNLHWTDLEALIEQGHTIGGHTRTHARLSQIAAGPELEREIISSADVLAQRLGVLIEHFAYTFGDIGSFSEEAMAVARQRFRFVYSALRGDNCGGVSPFALRREGVTGHDSVALVSAFVEGAADFRYRRSRALLSAWASKPNTAAS